MPDIATLDMRYVDQESDVVRCFPLIFQLRPHLESVDEFVERWRRQAIAGYRLLALWDGDRPVALAGFRVQDNLVHGRHLYIDDLVTDAHARSSGLGRLLITRLKALGCSQGLDKLILDTPLSNVLGHRFYYREGLVARSLRFSVPLGGAEAMS